MKRDTLQHEIARDSQLRDLMQKYAGFALGQFAQTAACDRLHALEARLCRWLLTAHDSMPSDTFPLTHEYLAMMLGVQRAGVSIAASFLKQAALIHYARGSVTVLNRSGLEDAACECYGTTRAQLNKLFGRLTKS
jgi:CRP-like cAMP-binding protein